MLRIKGLGARGEEAAGKPSRGTNQAEEPEEKARGRTRRWGRLDLGWPVSRCRSSDYRKCVPLMGSTRVQEDAEDQGVRRQRGRSSRKTKQRNQAEEPTKQRNQKKKQKEGRGDGEDLIWAGG